MKAVLDLAVFKAVTAHKIITHTFATCNFLDYSTNRVLCHVQSWRHKHRPGLIKPGKIW